MNVQLNEVVKNIADEFEGAICHDGRNYVEIDIGSRSAMMGHPESEGKYNRVNAIVPLKEPVKGMKVRIDGRTFANYAQYESGVAVPGNLADDAGLPYKPFVPNDSMILNFA